jgi:hypothetical protein
LEDSADSEYSYSRGCCFVAFFQTFHLLAVRSSQDGDPACALPLEGGRSLNFALPAADMVLGTSTGHSDPEIKSIIRWVRNRGASPVARDTALRSARRGCVQANHQLEKKQLSVNPMWGSKDGTRLSCFRFFPPHGRRCYVGHPFSDYCHSCSFGRFDRPVLFFHI